MSALSCLFYGAAGIFCPAEVPPPPPPPPPVVAPAPAMHQHDGFPVHDVRTRHHVPKPKPEPTPSSTTTTTMPTPIVRTPEGTVGLGFADIGSDGAFWCTDLIAWLYPDVDLGSDPGPVNASLAFPPTDTPQPGDIVLIELFHGNGIPEHVAIVEFVAAHTVHVIEANGSESRTHVARNTYGLEDVFGFRSTR